jgi:hypothetical protein
LRDAAPLITGHRRSRFPTLIVRFLDSAVQPRPDQPQHVWIDDPACHNKALVYDLLFRAASETMLTIAADPRHLGARIGITAVLHTWGQQ